MAATRQLKWRVLGDEDAVRQHAMGSYAPYLDTSLLVHAVGDGLVAGLSAAADQKGLPRVSSFDDLEPLPGGQEWHRRAP